MPDWGSIVSLAQWLREYLARPKVLIEVKKASWAKLKEGTDDNLNWRETCVKVELRLLNTGVKTTIMDIRVSAMSGHERFPSLLPKRIQPVFFASSDPGGPWSSSFSYSVHDSKAPLPVLVPHEPVTLELSFLIPGQIAEEEVTCELQFSDTYKKRWACTFVARQEPLK